MESLYVHKTNFKKIVENGAAVRRLRNVTRVTYYNKSNNKEERYGERNK